ncbi:reverse transcriptase [Tanacetum coccineum]
MSSVFGSTVSFVTSGSFSTTGGGIGGPSYEAPLRVVIALASFLGFGMVLLVEQQLHPRIPRWELGAFEPCLRKCRGEVTQSGSLPVCNEQGVMKVEPIAILDRRLAKRGNVAAVFVLVQWANGSKEDATWEPIEQVKNNFPSFKL